MSNNDYNKGVVNYTARDYTSFLSEFFKLVPKMTSLWTPEADADPGVVLGKLIASGVDLTNSHVDWQANEVYAASVSQTKDAQKLFELIGYELGWYTAARTEVTFKNVSETNSISLDFGFNGSNFATLNAYTDITDQARVITYNILPNTNKYGAKETRSKRDIVTSGVNVFASSDVATLAPGESVTRVAIEGELRSASWSVEDIKKKNYVVTLPSQHIDTTAVWIKAKTSSGEEDNRQWIQCSSPAEFIIPEPRFAVTYDSYSNAQVQISNYLDQLENYSGNYLTIYWIDCSGVIGCVGENVLQNYLQAIPDPTIDDMISSGEVKISNLSNTLELPHTNVVTGKSPETAKEAYFNSRNFINTWDSLITIPDFTRFLNREPGVDCGVVLDCQKAAEINLEIYNDTTLTDAQKSKMYINNYDFEAGEDNLNWQEVFGLDFDPNNVSTAKFSVNFKKYTAMCYAIHNDFRNSSYGENQIAYSRYQNVTRYIRYKPPVQFIEGVKRDYIPIRAANVNVDFGYLRVFPFKVIGTVYPKHSVDRDGANSIVSNIVEALSLFLSPANRPIGVKPTLMDIIDVIRSADSRIDYFDAGSSSTEAIQWLGCDIEYFNPISFAKFDSDATLSSIKVASSYITN